METKQIEQEIVEVYIGSSSVVNVNVELVKLSDMGIQNVSIPISITKTDLKTHIIKFTINEEGKYMLKVYEDGKMKATKLYNVLSSSNVLYKNSKVF